MLEQRQSDSEDIARGLLAVQLFQRAGRSLPRSEGSRLCGDECDFPKEKAKLRREKANSGATAPKASAKDASIFSRAGCGTAREIHPGENLRSCPESGLIHIGEKFRSARVRHRRFAEAERIRNRFHGLRDAAHFKQRSKSRAKRPESGSAPSFLA